MSRHSEIMRVYDRRMDEDLRGQADRIEEVCEKIPRMRELNRKAGASAVERYREYLRSGDPSRLEGFAGELEALAREKAALLREAGFPEDYMEMRYTCPDCKDTGYIDGQKCHCYRRMEQKMLYEQSRLDQVIRRENFGVLDMDLYDDTRVIDALGMTQRAYMEKVAAYCRRYAEEFSEKGGSILFTGSTGTGKTFLTNCIAAELIRDCHSVIYLTATELFDVMGKVRIDKVEDDGITELYERLNDAELLIIDDLGSELANSMTVSNLFSILNKRLILGKSLIISTNLSLNSMRDIYSERVTSRLQSSFDIIPLYGEDIRLRKR